MGACGGTNVVEEVNKPKKIDIANTVINLYVKLVSK